jgi:hypothetical protein
MADMMFLLSALEKDGELDVISDEAQSADELPANILYDYFQKHYVDTGKITSEEERIFNEMSVELFNAFFVQDYFATKTYEHIERTIGEDAPADIARIDKAKNHPNVVTYMADIIDRSEQMKSAIAFFTLSSSLDYVELTQEIYTAANYQLEYVYDVGTNEYLKDQFLKVHQEYSSVDAKLCSLIRKDVDAGELVFQAFTPEHKKYHAYNLDRDMYSCMVDAVVLSGLSPRRNSKVLQNLFIKENLVLPDQEGIEEGQDSFAKLFFDIGTSERGDGNELITEKLAYILNTYDYDRSFGGIQYSSYLETLRNLDEEQKLAYMDFLFLGDVPGSDADGSKQAHYFSYARAAGLKAMTTKIYESIDYSEEVKSKNSDKGLFYDLMLKHNRFSETLEYIPYSRYLPYSIEYVVATAHYYTSNQSENDALLKDYIKTSILNNQEQADSSSVKSTRSTVSIGPDTFMAAIESIIDQLFETVDTFFANIKAFFFGDDIEVDELPDSNATTQYENSQLALSSYIVDANDDLLQDISNGAYTDINLYNSADTWEYMPINVSELDYLVLNDESQNLEAEFHIESGFVYLYMVSQDDIATLREKLDPELTFEAVESDDILSRSNTHKLYRMTIVNGSNINVGSISSNVDAILFDSREANILK